MNKTVLGLAAALTLAAATSAAAQGPVLNGISLNGIDPNGVNFNGINFNGMRMNGWNLNGVATAGRAPMIDTCDQKQPQLCKPHPGLRVQSVILPAKAGALSRGGPTKGSGGMNGVSRDGFAAR